MVGLLVEREGGLVPLTRMLKKAGVFGIWPGRLKAMAAGREVPPWPVLECIGRACGVADFAAIRADWHAKYRRRLEEVGLAPLAVEVRLLIGEAATSARALSPRLHVSYPVLTARSATHGLRQAGAMAGDRTHPSRREGGSGRSGLGAHRSVVAIDGPTKVALVGRAVVGRISNPSYR